MAATITDDIDNVFIKSQNLKQEINESDTSDTSTVEGNCSIDNIAADDAGQILPDEPFTYLTGLNSDNLMQFSQQSALQELMLQERNDIKPKVSTLPVLENHDFAGYEFDMVINQPSKSTWVYSESLNKIYIRMNQIFNIDVVYKPKMPIQQLRLRAFLCFVQEISQPVLRCQNHISKDPEKNDVLLQNLLRCENPSAQYYGSENGKTIIDRFSVVIPLTTTAPKDNKTVKQTASFKFTCQNSCFGRKETNIVFCLENVHGEILGQKVVDIKVCCCPKRDRSLDERHLNNTGTNKRKATDETGGPKLKFLKALDPCTPKEELSRSSSEENDSGEDEIDLKELPNGRYRLVFDCLDRDQALQFIDRMIDTTAGAILQDDKFTHILFNQSQKLLSIKKRLKR